MQVRKILTSLTFRYIAKYLAALTATVFVLLGILYGYFSYNYFTDLGESILEELDTINLIYNGQSIEGVTTYIEDQSASPALQGFYYLVTDEQGAKVAGDLEASPSYKEFSDGWLGFELAMSRWGEAVDAEFLARRDTLPNGYEVMVGRNYADVEAGTSLVFRILFQAMMVTLVLGLIGGYFSASATLNRIENINRDLSGIIRGDPHQRLPVDEQKGYVRELSVIMNSMLDQMEALMIGVRRVSDNIAHDLRTPLTRMRNQLSQLSSRVPEAATDDVERIIDECDELLASFNALLRISTLETGSRLSGGAPVDLGELLRDVVELYEPVAQEKQVEIRLNAPSRQCMGEVDLLFQMFANLIDNAVKYTPRHGRIEVALHPGGEEGHCVVIADSGPGIAVADRKNVFRRFFRVESSRGQHPGHGLGLSLVQAIAHYHHGTIDLGSNNPGLRVRVKLP